MHKNLIFNPKYLLRNDVDRVLLTNKRDFPRNGIYYFVHPIHAMLLSHFNGAEDMNTTMSKICKDFNINMDVAKRLIDPIIKNQEEVTYRYDGNVFTLPPEILVENSSNMIRSDLNEENYEIDKPLNFSRRRLGRPVTLIFCINLKCYTDCVYCYANRKAHYKAMTPDQWVNLIYEAKEEGIASIELTGGEFYLNPEWDKIAKALLDCGYDCEASTKVPLSKETIDRAAAIGIKKIQFSLDTLDAETAVTDLCVNKNYTSLIKDSIKYCDQKGINVVIKPTLTKQTATKENVGQIIDFVKELKHVDRCVFTIIGYSMYKTDQNYLDIRPSKEQMEEVANLVIHRSSEVSCPMYNDNGLTSASELCSYKAFKNRALCTANVDGLVILPDGQVSVCEEMYWHQAFLLGDVKKNTIKEIWNSEKALKLWNISQEDIPEDSKCHTCQEFNKCRRGLGVCWKMAMQAYGLDKYYYPDPRCPRATTPVHPFCFD